MRSRWLAAVLMALAAAPAAAAEYSVGLDPSPKGTLARLRLFAEGPVGGPGLYGTGSGAFDLPGAIPQAGTARFERVPVRLRVGGRTFAGLATVTFTNGAFEGLVAETLSGEGSVLRLNGNAYAFGDGSSTVTGRVSAEPAATTTPEPSTWATIVLGVGLIGLLLRVAGRRAVQEP